MAVRLIVVEDSLLNEYLDRGEARTILTVRFSSAASRSFTSMCSSDLQSGKGLDAPGGPPSGVRRGSSRHRRRYLAVQQPLSAIKSMYRFISIDIQSPACCRADGQTDNAHVSCAPQGILILRDKSSCSVLGFLMTSRVTRVRLWSRSPTGSSTSTKCI